MATDAEKDGFVMGDIYETSVHAGRERLVVRVTGFPAKTLMSLEILETQSHVVAVTPHGSVSEISLVQPLAVAALRLVRKSSRYGWSFMMNQGMIVRNQRKINSKAARAMITWAHYRFKQRMLFKRQEYPWCKVVVCDEAYTSKTCGQCGKLHHALGGSKVFRCPSCGLQVDRDAHAARNILLKNASLFGFTA